MKEWRAYLRKDGWIWAALLFCVALCLFLGGQSQSPGNEESRISRVLSSIDGAGAVDVAIYYQDSLPCGAVVVADGADNVTVQLRLTSAITTLLGIDLQRVAVYDREGTK